MTSDEQRSDSPGGLVLPWSTVFLVRARSPRGTDARKADRLVTSRFSLPLPVPIWAFRGPPSPASA